MVKTASFFDLHFLEIINIMLNSKSPDHTPTHEIQIITAN